MKATRHSGSERSIFGLDFITLTQHTHTHVAICVKSFSFATCRDAELEHRGLESRRRILHLHLSLSLSRSGNWKVNWKSKLLRVQFVTTSLGSAHQGRKKPNTRLNLAGAPTGPSQLSNIDKHTFASSPGLAWRLARQASRRQDSG